MVSLAFTVYSNKGVYALLLGSGISRASGIPTGWEVVLDLIRKVAKLQGEDCEPDPAEWFRKKHGSEPDYSKLLDAIAKSPTERQQLLRGYFEPTEDERSQELKLPSAAHRAIARLAASGYLRVILTTNFDRLTERALEEVGVTPTVISSSDQLAGALPLAHSGVTIIKLHGDYLDTRIKNTDSELAGYDPAMDRLLGRVLDEYGLIVSGWSGEWDAALRTAMERCPSRRFTTFWTTRSPLGEKAKRLADHRQAVVVQAKDANDLFGTLQENVQALEDLNAPHPLSAKMAAATVKRCLVDPTAKIRLHDLVHEETEKLFAGMNALVSGGDTRAEPKDELPRRAAQYEAISEILGSVLTTGCYWGNEGTAKLWVASLQRIANPSSLGGGLEYLLKLRRYPALLLLYASGIAAVASGNYQTLAAVLLQSRSKDDHGRDRPLLSVVYPIAVFENSLGCLLPGSCGGPTPVSNHLYLKLRGWFHDYLPGEEDYQDAFDRFEYLFGLIYADLIQTEWAGNAWWGPVGCFAWRGSDFFPERRIQYKVGLELEAEGANWQPLKAGLLGGSVDRARTAKSRFDTFLNGLRFR